MRAGEVTALQRQLAEHGLDWCVVGGWGVDALLGVETRAHKDLDVLLPLAALPLTMRLLAEEGFHLDYTWEESRPITGRDALLGEPIPSAFVLADGAGREIDVHVYDLVDSRVEILWDTDRTLTPEDLSAAGQIGGLDVRCMTAAMQLTCHEGYDLPTSQAEDVRLLQRMTRKQEG